MMGAESLRGLKSEAIGWRETTSRMEPNEDIVNELRWDVVDGLQRN